MTLIALVSAGNAPGVTTTAFALTLNWPGSALLAECDPSGGHILAGYFHGAVPADRGIWHFALDLHQGRPNVGNLLTDHVVPLDGRGERLLFPGARGPFLLSDFTSETWTRLSEVFGALPMDVLADIGHIGADLPFPLIGAADLVVLVMHPTFGQVAAARPRIDALREALGEGTPIALCLIGKDGYGAAEISASLGTFITTIVLPDDPRSARTLHQGEKTRGFATGPLMRTSAAAAKELHRVAVQQHAAVQGQAPAGFPVVGAGR